jgi:hypothetical protein
MGKFHWKKGELDKLDKEIKKYNRRVNELLKQGFTEKQLPVTGYKKSINKDGEVERTPLYKMNYYDTRDLIIKNNENPREYLKDQFKIINIMINKKNEKTVKSKRGLELPSFTKKITELKVKEINKKREQQKEYYKQFDVTSRNQKIHQANSDVEDKFRDKKFNWKNMSRNDFDMYQKTLEEFSVTEAMRNAQYRVNFYKALEKIMTKEEYDHFKPIIDKVPSDILVKQYYVDKDMSIGFTYEKADRDLLIESIIESWSDLAKESGFL